MFLLLAPLLLIFLPWPWSLVAALASGALGVAEVGYWQRRMRRRKVVTGVEDLVGAIAEVTETCAPRGRVRLQGELWEARSKREIGRGRPVRVVAVHGLVLEVEPMSGGSRNGAKDLGVTAAMLAAAVALALGGCGGDDDEDSAESWANDVCSSLSTWVSDVEETVQSVTDAGLAIDEEDLQTAVDDVSEATSTLVDDLEELGPPETESGEEARGELDSLATTLESEVETVRQAVESDGGAAELASTVSASISTASAEVSSTLESLQEADPGGELEEGFENADECDSFRDQIEDLDSDS
jgi:membrane protein implicated in regulation of membrane protease activity